MYYVYESGMEGIFHLYMSGTCFLTAESDGDLEPICDTLPEQEAGDDTGIDQAEHDHGEEPEGKSGCQMVSPVGFLPLIFSTFMLWGADRIGIVRHREDALSTRHTQTDIWCIGEAVWDSTPAGLFLGGAPLTVAMHLRQLGVSVSLVSAVGDDRLGYELRRRLTVAGVNLSLLGVNTRLETGFVVAELEDSGNASYTIFEGVAWDHLPIVPMPPPSSPALVYSSLVMRTSHGLSRLSSWLQSVKPSGFLTLTSEPLTTVSASYRTRCVKPIGSKQTMKKQLPSLGR